MVICLIGIGIIAIFWLIFLYNYVCDKLMVKYDNLSSKYSRKDEEKSKLYYKKYKFWRNAGFWFTDDSRICAILITVGLVVIFGLVFAGMKGQAYLDYKKALDTKSQIEYGTFIINCDEDYLEGLFFTSNKESGQLELYRK